jgi:hypothetical protein
MKKIADHIPKIFTDTGFIVVSYRFQSKNIKIEIYRTMILLVLCGCETWSVTLMEEGRLRLRRKC